MNPIRLWRPDAALVSDDACTTILKYTLPPRPTPGPYERAEESGDVYVPSLKTLCMKMLLEYPDQLYTLGPVRVHYEIPKTDSDYDLLRSLIPEFSHADPDISFLEAVDPRLWATIIQTLTPIPEALRVYTIPLSDIHLPLLQQIPPTPDFALITVLELRECPHLDDDTIHLLGDIPTLGALDISRTAVTSWGIRALSRSLVRQPSTVTGRKGPWGLRVLDLRDCKCDSQVMQYLSCFPLLSVVDLSGNDRCRVHSHDPSGFRACHSDAFYGPAPLIQRLKMLIPSGSSPEESLFSSPEPYFLYINRLNHLPCPTRPNPTSRIPSITPQASSPSIVTFPAPLSNLRYMIQEFINVHAMI
ncbi:hypothetical protein EIP91_006469 [Steccherinum ochraceum]|uniref:Uncharacterized protein n=1 Tax=Steccherinum ochraceum TaxID=92696 RepID=A0A4R0RR78_9APHY|nr:hypothetical protein EIP91_006469 [Steccherinum ochraceum]